MFCFLKLYFKFFFPFLVIAFFSSCKHKAKQKWELIFQDDFNKPEIDIMQWKMYNSPGHSGNGLRRPSAFSIQHGYLVVTAQMQNNNIVSGGMAHQANYTYGKFEFKVRTEKDPSQATSGVVLTWPESERWPIDGENDMYETGTNAERNFYNSFIHYGTDANTQYQFNHKKDATKWHVVAMEWNASAVKIYDDDVLVWTLTDKKAIPDVPHHLCIQLDAFKKTMADKVSMYIDWVKIYKAA